MEPNFIDTTAALKKFLGNLGDIKSQPPRLYMDLEENDLSRNGTLSLMTILLEPDKEVYLVDVTTLGQEAFTTTDDAEKSLKSILESPHVVKVFFDIRNDSDALFSHYGIRVAGVEDLQLMELASRTFSRRCVNGLAKCIERESSISFAERRQWQSVKDKGRSLFDPSRGGSYAVFDQRPLLEDMKRYCVQDVTFMPHLRKVYRQNLCDAWWGKIEAETNARIQLSQSPSYNGKGRHMALGPPGWLSWSPSPSERHVRTLLKEPSVRDSDTAPVSTQHAILQSEHSSVIANALQEALMADDYVVDSEPGDIGCTYDSDRDSDGGWKDYTACDKECGYCGKCPY